MGIIALIKEALTAYVLSLKAATALVELQHRISKAKWDAELGAVLNRLDSGEVISNEESKALAAKLAALTADI